MLPNNETNSFASPLPPKLQQTFTDFTLVSEEANYLLFNAKSRATDQQCTIRVLDLDSPMVKENYDLMATLFIQELLRLSTHQPRAIFIEGFEISGKKIAYCTLPYSSLSKNPNHIPKQENDLVKMISQVCSDIEFLSNGLSIWDSSTLIQPHNIYRFDNEEEYFLGNWAEALQAPSIQTRPLSTFTNSQGARNSKDASYLLAVTVLELKGLPNKITEQLRASSDPELSTLAALKIPENFSGYSEQFQSLMKKCLHQNPEERPDLKEFQIEADKKNLGFEALNPSASKILKYQPKLLAVCSRDQNKISIYDLQNSQEINSFEGAKIKSVDEGSTTFVKEIPDSSMLVSIHHAYGNSVNFEVFNVNKQGSTKLFGSGEIRGSAGPGDIAHTTKKKLLAFAPMKDKNIAYHLFDCKNLAMLRRPKWELQHTGDWISGLDFDPEGFAIAKIDRNGVCLLSEVDTSNYLFHFQFKQTKKEDDYARCRWSSVSGDPTLFCKYDNNMLNILDVEKRLTILTDPVALDENNKMNRTWWIDVLQGEGNLVVSGGYDRSVKVFDRREAKVVTTFNEVHSDYIRCVRWNQSGSQISSASDDKTAKVIDFSSGRIVNSFTPGANDARSVCFL